MKTKQQISLIFVALLVAAACGSNGSGGDKVTEPLPFPEAPPSGVQGDGQLGELVRWAVDAQEIPAMAVIVVHNGQVVDFAAEGVRVSGSNQAVTAGDAWHIGSLTKGMTASLVGVMVEMGVVSWDTRPLDVWPELDGSIHRDLREITIRHLLSHSAGIERVNAAPSRYADEASGTLIDKRRAFAAELLRNTPVVDVGTYSYSNGGYIIVGAMLETMMSDSWESLLTDYVLAPLAMSDTGFGAPGQAGELSEPWGHWEHNDHLDPVPPGPDADNPQVFGPAGTVHTTLDDYAKFMISHIDGFNGFGSFISADTFQELHTPIVEQTGLGWGVGESTDFPGRVLLAHAGSNLRWYAIVKLVPELDGGAFFVVNSGGNRAQAAIDRVEDFVVDRYKAMP